MEWYCENGEIRGKERVAKKDEKLQRDVFLSPKKW